MGKYFKYAIGEILLVVVGILIALQINNWNEQRKTNYREIYLLQQMQKEFKTDSTMLERFIFLTKMKTNEGKRIRQVINNEIQMSKDSIVVQAFFNGRTVLFNDYTPTFDEIVASGNLNIIKSDKLKNAIKRYKNYINQSQSFMYYEAQRRKESYNTHLYKYFEAEIMTFIWESDGTNISELNNFKADIEGFLSDPETLHHVNILIGLDRELQSTYERNYMALLNQILNELKSEIDKTND